MRGGVGGVGGEGPTSGCIIFICMVSSSILIEFSNRFDFLSLIFGCGICSSLSVYRIGPVPYLRGFCGVALCTKVTERGILFPSKKQESTRCARRRCRLVNNNKLAECAEGSAASAGKGPRQGVLYLFVWFLLRFLSSSLTDLISFLSSLDVVSAPLYRSIGSVLYHICVDFVVLRCAQK